MYLLDELAKDCSSFSLSESIGILGKKPLRKVEKVVAVAQDTVYRRTFVSMFIWLMTLALAKKYDNFGQ